MRKGFGSHMNESRVRIGLYFFFGRFSHKSEPWRY